MARAQDQSVLHASYVALPEMEVKVKIGSCAMGFNLATSEKSIEINDFKGYASQAFCQNKMTPANSYKL